MRSTLQGRDVHQRSGRINSRSRPRDMSMPIFHALICEM
jgi:hypothetical protein